MSLNLSIKWPGSFRTKGYFYGNKKIETNLAYAGLNSAHVGDKGLNKPTIKTAAF